MSVLNIECGAGEGNALANILRRYIVGNCETWRPIGFKFSKESADANGANSAIISNNIIQSFMKFQAQFLELDFEIDEHESDIFRAEYTFNGTFTSASLNSEYVTCTPTDVQLLQTINNQNVSFDVYYRKSFGAHTAEENYDFLKEKLGASYKIDFPVAASVHYVNRRHVTYSVDSYDTKDIIHMTMVGCDNPEQILEEAKNHIISSILKLNIREA